MEERHERRAPAKPRLDGVLAEFATAGGVARGLREGARRGLQAAGTPTRRSRCTASTTRWASGSTQLPWLVLGGGLAGAVGGILLQWWTNAVDYPFLISGKPLFSLPANIPVAFELTILLARSPRSSGCWR